MYGLPKIHKHGNPLRPIVSSTGSVSYQLSKYLASLLNPVLGTISGSHITNSENFINKIINTNLERKIMISLDVLSLFTNVPIDGIVEFLHDYLQDNLLNLPF